MSIARCRRPDPRRRWPAPAALALVLLAAGCGQANNTTGRQAASRAPASCEQVALGALTKVAQRVYMEAVRSANQQTAVRFVETSAPLAAAVAAQSPSAVAAAARTLIASGHVARLRVDDGSHELADVGSAGAVGPSFGLIRGPDGSAAGYYEVAIQTASGVALTASGLTEAQVVIRTAQGATLAVGNNQPVPARLPAQGAVSVDGQPLDVSSFTGEAFDGGVLGVSVLRSPSSLAQYCRPTAPETVAATLGDAGTRIYRFEVDSVEGTNELERVVENPPLLQAVAHRNPVAARRAIDALLNQHIVRIRVFARGQALQDVGGPHVLAPLGARLLLHGRHIGRVVISVQDDLGYFLLARRLLGLDVVIRQGASEVLASLPGDPPALPDFGPVQIDGQSFVAYSFAAEAFPKGPLRITLLVPDAIVDQLDGAY
ncbi:MAG TPA: hypothetical protein VHX88_04260 [Solirubrobacteraceae bacterium]|jgi:hypothetical protein|nr:hypothetical protein [Solirubrobacteraceae bacterium]